MNIGIRQNHLCYSVDQRLPVIFKNIVKGRLSGVIDSSITPYLPLDM